jgi:polyphosphate glucokinase
MTFGAGRDHANKVVLMLTVGTGIGTALFTHVQLLPNSEFGHLQIKGTHAEKWARRFQGFLDEMEKLLNPVVIIIGGGVSKQYKEFSGLLNAMVILRVAQFQNTARIIGTALNADVL